MTLQEVMKLVNAGFTAEDVRKMMEEPVPKKEEPVPKKEEPVPKKEEPVPKKEEPVPKKEEPAGAYIDEIISGINKKIDELTGSIDKISKISLFPAMGRVEPLGIDDVIDKFFGDKKEE